MKEEKKTKYVWVVSVYANDVEPVVTVFYDEIEARKYYDDMKDQDTADALTRKKGSRVCIDHCPVYTKYLS